MDKNKIIENAGKLVAKGAYDKALREYQRVLEVDPKDVRTLQKIGDLYQKKNDVAQAAHYFTKVAESYTSDGFLNKAASLYKQILKLDPTLVDVNLKLAELHQQLQLMSEAMAYYQVVVKHYDAQGDTRASLAVLRKMVDLDPDNVASRVKLADLYLREGMQEEARGEFSRAAEHLKRFNRTDEYLRVAERLLSMEPDNLALARELAQLYLERNDQKRALAKLQVCFKADSRDVETLRLLAIAFHALGQTAKTVSVYKELARAWEERGHPQEAEQVWAQVGQLDPNDPDLQARLAARAPPPAPPPVTYPSGVSSPSGFAGSAGSQAGFAGSGGSQAGFAGAPAGAAPYAAPADVWAPPPPPPRPRGDNINKLLTETDVYVKYGLHDKALEHLRKVFAVDPENIDAHEKAYALYVASNNHAQAFEQLLNVLRLHTRSGDAQRAQPYLAMILQQNPAHPEVPAFLQALQLSGTAPASADLGPAAVPEDAILVDSLEDEVIVADEPDDVISAEVSVATDEPFSEPEIVADEPLDLSPADAAVAEQFEVAPPPVEGFADDDAPEQIVSDFDDEYRPGFEEPETGEFNVVDEAPAAPQPIPLTTVPAQRLDLPMALGEETHDAPTRLAEALQVPPAPWEESSFEGVDDGGAWAQPEAAPAWDAPPEEAQAWEVPADESAAPGGDDGSAAEECEEASFFLDQGLLEEAREILETILIAYPEHPRARALLEQLEQAEAGEAPVGTADGETTSGSSAFDLAAELADLGELQDDAGAPGGPGGDDYQVSVEEVFAEFKKGLEKVVKPEDVDTHYDLGVAYKEMGLTDDAVSEFSIARKGCLGERKEIDCLSMIGMLQSMKGDYPQAVDALTQALASQHAAGDTEKALRYDLAAAWEGAGEAGKALGQYLRVQELDAGYRDVSAHVERLAAVATPEDETREPAAGRPNEQGGRPARKVGYV